MNHTYMRSIGKRWHLTAQQQTISNGRHRTSPRLDLQATVCHVKWFCSC